MYGILRDIDTHSLAADDQGMIGILPTQIRLEQIVEIIHVASVRESFLCDVDSSWTLTLRIS